MDRFGSGGGLLAKEKWQVTQSTFGVAREWSINAPENETPAIWQVSQSVMSTTECQGGGGGAPEGLPTEWQLLQSADPVTTEWSITAPAKEPPGTWQLPQSVISANRCQSGGGGAPDGLPPTWHEAQLSPAEMPA